MQPPLLSRVAAEAVTETRDTDVPTCLTRDGTVRISRADGHGRERKPGNSKTIRQVVGGSQYTGRTTHTCGAGQSYGKRWMLIVGAGGAACFKMNRWLSLLLSSPTLSLH